MTDKRKREVLEKFMEDVLYVRAHGTRPWGGKAGRRDMEKRYTYKEKLTVQGKSVELDLSVSVSCTYVRYTVSVLIDGVGVKQYMKPLQELADSLIEE